MDEAIALLGANGIPRADGGMAMTEADAVATAGRIGYPVAMKIAGPGLVHKSDIGGVVLNVRDGAGVEKGWDLIAERTGVLGSQQETGCYVQKMVSGVAELLLAVQNDPQFGPILTVGAGGMLAELLGDVQIRRLPVSRREAQQMLEQLAIWPVLAGGPGRRARRRPGPGRGNGSRQHRGNQAGQRDPGGRDQPADRPPGRSRRRGSGCAYPAGGRAMSRLAPAQRPASPVSAQLTRLFRSSHLALVGASDTSRFMGQAVGSNEQLNYAGHLSLVNPRHDEVLGRRCWPSLSALPEVPDAAVISVPAAHVPDIVAEGIELGIRSFVVHSAGFAEHSALGAERQAALRSMCEQAGAVLIGPNCMGALSLTDAVALSGMPLPFDITAGDIGVIAQSGSAATALMNSGRGLRFSYVVSSGNEAVTTTEDLIEFLVGDPGTRMILVFTEGFKQPRRLVEVGREALAAGKPIVLLENRDDSTLQSDRAEPHRRSGGLRGGPRRSDGTRGNHLVRDFDEMVETAVLLSSGAKTPGARQNRHLHELRRRDLTHRRCRGGDRIGRRVVLASTPPPGSGRSSNSLDTVQATNPMDSGMGSVSSVPFKDRLRTALNL